MGPFKYIGKLITIRIDFPVLTFVLFTHMHTQTYIQTHTLIIMTVTTTQNVRYRDFSQEPAKATKK